MLWGTYAAECCDDLDVDYADSLHIRRFWMAWFQCEGNVADWNPTNTTKDAPGAVSINSVGVKDYPSSRVGIKTTVATFHEPGFGYQKVLRLMRQNAPAREICAALGDTPWGTSKTLMLTVRAELGRVPLYLRTLERKTIHE